VQQGGLVKVTVGVQEAGQGGGDPDGVPGPLAGGRVADCGVQVGALGLHPRGRLPVGGQAGGMGRRAAGRQPVGGGAGPRGDVPGGNHGGVQVVVQQPPGRGVAIPGVVGGGQGPGVFAEQVVQLAAAGRGLGEQVLVIQLIEAAAGLVQAGAIEGGGGVGVDAGARHQAKAAEQPLLPCGEVGIGQVKRGRHG
jgi:hypothetical protein